MGLKEFYNNINGDYEGTIARLMNEQRMEKYLKMFLSDEEYNLLVISLSNKDYTDAFLHVHNMKGIALNLGFSKLATSASTLCELIRHGAPKEDPNPYLEKITIDYNDTIKEIKKEFNL